MHLKKSMDQQIKKNKTNELHVEKLVRIVNFLAHNSVPVKELYPKIIKFLSGEINEPVINNILKYFRKMLPMTPLILVIL